MRVGLDEEDGDDTVLARVFNKQVGKQRRGEPRNSATKTDDGSAQAYMQSSSASRVELHYLVT